MLEILRTSVPWFALIVTVVSLKVPRVILLKAMVLGNALKEIKLC